MRRMCFKFSSYAAEEESRRIAIRQFPNVQKLKAWRTRFFLSTCRPESCIDTGSCLQSVKTKKLHSKSCSFCMQEPATTRLYIVRKGMAPSPSCKASNVGSLNCSGLYAPWILEFATKPKLMLIYVLIIYICYMLLKKHLIKAKVLVQSQTPKCGVHRADKFIKLSALWYSQILIQQ